MNKADVFEPGGDIFCLSFFFKADADVFRFS
jgi:hypothetical protein